MDTSSDRSPLSLVDGGALTEFFRLESLPDPDVPLASLFRLVPVHLPVVVERSSCALSDRVEFEAGKVRLPVGELTGYKRDLCVGDL